MASTSPISSLASSLNACDCESCKTTDFTHQLEEPKNRYDTVGSMARNPRENDDYFGHNQAALESEHEDMTSKDEQIRTAPYLSKIQVWARPDGPYTIRVGQQWFHCDDLIINGAEYRQKSRNDVAPRTKETKRPAASRSQSYQRTRPSKEPTATVTKLHSNSSSNSDMATPVTTYQPQTLPTPKEQAGKRRAERRRQKDAEAEKFARRERRDSGVSVPDQPSSQGALVTYTHPPPTQAPQAVAQMRPARPAPLRRGSSRNGSYTIPVRSRGKKNVRFAALPR